MGAGRQRLLQPVLPVFHSLLAVPHRPSPPSLPPPPVPAVCLYLGAVTNPPCLVMEYCAKCSLDHLLCAGLGNPQVRAGVRQL